MYLYRCEQAGEEAKPWAEATCLPVQRSLPSQYKALEQARQKGHLRVSSVDGNSFHAGTITYVTDSVVLTEPRILCCAQAAVVHATGMTLEELGLDKIDISSGLGFSAIQGLLQLGALSSAFVLRKPANLTTSVDVFRCNHGVFLIHCFHYHSEDKDFDMKETIPHYVVYNAATRVLFLYPEVCVPPCESCHMPIYDMYVCTSICRLSSCISQMWTAWMTLSKCWPASPTSSASELLPGVGCVVFVYEYTMMASRSCVTPFLQ